MSTAVTLYILYDLQRQCSIEIQSAIIRSLYTPGQEFPHYTAFLCTCKSLYQEAYPLFLSSYTLSCWPIKLGHPNARPGLGRGDILRLVYPHDDDLYRMHLYEDEWMSGIRSGIKDLFDIDSDDEADQEPNAIEKFEEEEGDYERIDAFHLNGMDGKSLFERGQQFAQYWIRNNRLAKLMRRIGKRRAQELTTLRITWGGSEPNRMDEDQQPGPFAIGIMSVVCSLFLPNITYVTLRQTKFDGFDDYIGRGCRIRSGRDMTSAISEEEHWPDHHKIEIMGQGEGEEEDSEQGHMITAIRLLIEACEDLRELELMNWYRGGRAQWWKEAFIKEGLVIKVMRNPWNRVY